MHRKKKEPNPVKRVIASDSVAWLLVGLALWTGLGYVAGGNAVTSSDSFAVLREIPGIHVLGVAYILLAIALGSAIPRGAGLFLTWVLSCGMGIYAFAALAIIAAWIVTGHIAAIGGPAIYAALAALYFLTLHARDPSEVASQNGR